MNATPHKVWIDLDNAPHVPFFAPVISKLEERGHEVWATARGRYQVSELAKMHGIRHALIGRKHYGRNKVMKALGVLYRALLLYRAARREKPALAISHGSRSQIIAATLAGIPTVVIIDYEHAQQMPLIKYDMLITPEVIPDAAFGTSTCGALCKYPGIKEDVYVASFTPSARIYEELGVSPRDIVVTIRPPATDAHYHREESEELFRASVEWLSGDQRTVLVLLPRNEPQERGIRERWPELVASGKLIIPPCAVDGLNLIWHSDLVLSGGGTMNREAAALGVPVYSIFRGEIGSVDRYLADQKRLILIEKVEDIAGLITLAKRERQGGAPAGESEALRCIVERLETMLGQRGAS